ncbi:YtpI family protein [Paenibacillus sp. T3-5-0-4]|nr:YtpI family protein [Paenibacillus endoradicis]
MEGIFDVDYAAARYSVITVHDFELHLRKELMMVTQFIQWFLSPVIFLSVLFAIYYSIKSRQAKDPIKKGILGGKLNISMGIMLIFISFVQLFLSNESTLRIVLGAIFLVLGIFNLFAGLRNISYFQRKAVKQ